jgi:FAD/FMN-containing dehydrogenase
LSRPSVMTNTVLSWGKYPNYPQAAHRINWRSEIPDAIEALKSQFGNTLPFGNGRSYGDSCLATSSHVLSTRSLDRIISADWDNGVVVVEPGMTLGELLNMSIPRGWFLPVTPGTQFATIGGAIANDVHGKNHHRRGTFGCHVPRFGLLRSVEGALTCSAKENPELYTATIGGLGLTGVIVWAEVHLAQIRSSQIRSVNERFGSLGEFFSLSRELDSQHEFGVAWIDCVAKGSAMGRGVYMAGDFAEEGSLTIRSGRKLAVPINPPFSLVNKLSLRLFNETYWRKQPSKRTTTLGHFEPFFYPLDGILHWNRIYGRKGFQQYQCVLPPEAAEAGTHALLRAIAESGEGSFLAVLKQFGDYKSPGLMSFPRPGVTLALDFPNHPQLDKGLFRRLDNIVREANGRLFPAKDAHMKPADFQAAYPQWGQLESLRDPALNSRFWHRVTQ